MKLNTRRTVLVGFAFLSICAFWQMYDSLIPLVLTDTFGVDETLSGVIMAADNVLALFLLPFFGGLSDQCTSRLGKRRPFILVGTLVAVCLMMGLPFLADSYHAAPTTGKVAGFIALLGLLLVAMGIYRSPAVALMPDVTPKPLRSKGNAIINLMGAIGGVLYLIITNVLYSASRVGDREYVSYVPLFAIVGGIMLAALAVLLCCIHERKLEAEMQALATPEEKKDETAVGGKMPADVRRSLIFLLVSVALWFIGYNAIGTWFTTYAQEMWGMALGDAALCLTIGTGGAIVSYIPVGHVASRIGRRRTIRFGAAMLAGCFALGFLYTLVFDSFSPVLYLLFVLVGIAWASINVNSFPMVVEMCSGSEVGKFTGLYYTFSMAAQTVTPIVAGFLLSHAGYVTLFPYAGIFLAASFVTMGFVKHGDAKVEAKKGLAAFEGDD